MSEGTVRPTLFIGLGGAGCEVLTKLRQRMLAEKWNGKRLSSVADYPFAEFLFFDPDTQHDARSYRLHHLPEAAPMAREWLSIVPGILDRYFQNADTLDRFPNIKTWFPGSFKDVRDWIDLSVERSNHHMPTPSPRCFARLAFFDIYRQIECSIRTALHRLNRSRFDRGQSETLGLAGIADRNRIVIISSAFGSTGSGALFDMGWLARKLSREERHHPNKIDLILTLPGESSRDIRHEANAYATLMELETVMRGRCRLVDGWDPQEGSLDLDGRPFHDVYLISESNMAGVQMQSPTATYDMVADSLFKDLKGSALAVKRYGLANCHMQFKIGSHSPPLPQFLGDFHLGSFKGYSSFGFAELPEGVLDVACNGDGPTSAEDGLAKIPRGTRTQELSVWLANAMPFVDALTDSEFIPPSGAYMHVVSVSSVIASRREDIEKELAANLPTRHGLDHRGINLVCQGANGRLVCYSEVSGFPLDWLRQIDRWRTGYERTSGGNASAFLHIHRDIDLFVHPTAPTIHDLSKLFDDAQLFLLAVILRIVERTSERTIPPGQYQFDFGHRDWRNIGNERALRMHGLPNEYRSHIERATNDTVEQLDPLQLKALSVLAEFLQRETYTPILSSDDRGCERPVFGFMHAAAQKLANDLAVLAKDRDLSESDSRQIESTFCDWDGDWEDLTRSLDTWTEVIPDSARDGYSGEVKEPDPDGSDRSKRRVKSEFLKAGWLQEQVDDEPPLL